MMAIFNLPLLRWRRVVGLSELSGRYYVHYVCIHIYIYKLYSAQRLLLKKKYFSTINENTIARWKYDLVLNHLLSIRFYFVLLKKRKGKAIFTCHFPPLFEYLRSQGEANIACTAVQHTIGCNYRAWNTDFSTWIPIIFSFSTNYYCCWFNYYRTSY